MKKPMIKAMTLGGFSLKGGLGFRGPQQDNMNHSLNSSRVGRGVLARTALNSMLLQLVEAIANNNIQKSQYDLY